MLASARCLESKLSSNEETLTMNSLHEPSGKLGALTAPRRNHYYFGKLMDVVHFQLEQSYGNGMRHLLNRLSLGEGVLCGLLVEKNPDNQICVTPGVAIDSAGREIVVPARACADPWTLTDECGQPSGSLPKDKAHLVHLCLAYRECGADFAPVLVEDCNLKQECAPGTIVESFRLLVQDILPPLPAARAAVCQALFTSQSAYAIVATVDIGGKPVALAVSPNGDQVLVAGETGPGLFAVEIESGAVTAISGTALIPPIGGIAVASDGGLFFVSHDNGIATVDLSLSPASVGSLVSGSKYGACAAMTGGDVLFAVNLSTNKVQRFDAGSATPTDLVTVAEPALVALSSDAKSLYVADAANKQIVRVDTATNVTGAGTALAQTPKALAPRPGDSAVHVTGDKHVTRVPDTGAVESFVISADATAGAFTSAGGRFYVIDRKAGASEVVVFQAEGLQEIARITIGEEPTGLALVPDSRRVLVIDAKSGMINILDVVPRKHLCEALSAPCSQPTDCPCVTLATIELRNDGTIGAINSCGPRHVLYSNTMLLEFILCLAARLDECCGGGAPGPAPKPPEPPLPAEEPFRIEKIEFLAQNNLVAPLGDLAAPHEFPADMRISAIRVVFNRPFDPETVTVATSPADAKTASFLVRRSEANSIVRGSIVSDGPLAVRFVTEEPNQFRVGEHSVTLFGDPDPAAGRPAIAEKAAGQARLDGEPGPAATPLPSGEGNEGGNFKFKFRITD